MGKEKYFFGLCSFFIAAVIAISFSGCVKNIIEPPVALEPGEMQASVGGGTFYTKNAHALDNTQTSTYGIKASITTADGKNDSIVFDFEFTKKSAPYTIDFSDGVSFMNYCLWNPNASLCANYHVDKNNGSGTLSITSITPGDNIQGTFSGTFKSTAGSETITVSNGEFYASF